MSSRERKQVSRRDFIKLGAAAAAPFFLFPESTRARNLLKIVKWAHFIPDFDSWFEAMAAGWANQHGATLSLENISVEDIWARAKAAAKSGTGGDIFIFPWPPAEFQQFAIDHSEIYENLSFKYGSIPQIAYKSTFNPKKKKHFGFADYWIPSPLHYFADDWTEANMPLGPVHYGSLRSGGQRIRAKLGTPCGLSFSPCLEGNVTSNTLFYAYRCQVLDADGKVAINRNAFTAEALKFVKALNQDAGTPDAFTWDSSGNVQAMLARKTSCTSNGISLLRAAEKQDPGVARQIRLQPPLLGPYGVTAFPQITNCSLIWRSAKNQDLAKQFLTDLVDNSKTGYDKSLGCNFPVYPKTLPNLILRLENDAQADPPHKYGQLKDALHWTPNLGAPGFATPTWMEVFNTSIIPRMFASVVKGDLSAEDAGKVTEMEVRQIAAKWKDV